MAKEWCSDLKRMELVSTIGLPSVLVFVVQVRSAERGSLPDGRSEIAESILRTLTRVQKSLLGCRNQIQGGSHASKRINGVLKVRAVPDMRCQAPQSFPVMTCLHKTCERKYHLQTGALDSVNVSEDCTKTLLSWDKDRSQFRFGWTMCGLLLPLPRRSIAGYLRIVKQGSACEESRRGQNATASRQAWVKQLKDDVRAQEEGAAWHQEIQQALLLLFVASRPAQAVVVVVVVNQF